MLKNKSSYKYYIKKPSADSLRSMNVSKSSPANMYQIKEREFKNIINNKFPSFLSNFVNTDKRKYYWQNGYVDIIKTEHYKKKSMCGKKVIPLLLMKKLTQLITKMI